MSKDLMRDKEAARQRMREISRMNDAGIPRNKIAEAFGITPTRVGQLVKKARRRAEAEAEGAYIAKLLQADAQGLLSREKHRLNDPGVQRQLKVFGDAMRKVRNK